MEPASFNSADYMLAMVGDLRQRYGIRLINFYDDQFTFDRARVMAFARGLADSGLGMTFNCAARAEHVDAELLRVLKAAGCWMISLGIETGTPELLARHRRSHFRRSLRRLRNHLPDTARASHRTRC